MKKMLILLSVIISLSGTNVYASYGDANGDKTVDAQDSMLIVNHVLNSAITIDERMSDVNGDGIIDAEDAACVMQKTLQSTFLFAKETADPEVDLPDTDILYAASLPYGKYTKPFAVGDIVISASAVSPVSVEDVKLYTDFVTGRTSYEKCLVFSQGSSICFNRTGNHSVLGKHIVTMDLVDNEVCLFYNNTFDLSYTSVNEPGLFYIYPFPYDDCYGEYCEGYENCDGSVILTAEAGPIALTKLGYADKREYWDWFKN